MTWQKQQEAKERRVSEKERTNNIHRNLHDAFWGRNGFELQKIEEKENEHSIEPSI